MTVNRWTSYCGLDAWCWTALFDLPKARACINFNTVNRCRVALAYHRDGREHEN